MYHLYTSSVEKNAVQVYFHNLLVTNNFNIVLPSVASLSSSFFTNEYLTDILNQSSVSSIH